MLTLFNGKTLAHDDDEGMDAVRIALCDERYAARLVSTDVRPIAHGGEGKSQRSFEVTIKMVVEEK